MDTDEFIVWHGGPSNPHSESQEDKQLEERLRSNE
jgi:hypothetical protein